MYKCVKSSVQLREYIYTQHVIEETITHTSVRMYHVYVHASLGSNWESMERVLYESVDGQKQWGSNEYKYEYQNSKLSKRRPQVVTVCEY